MTSEFHADTQGSPDSISASIEAALAAVSYPANKDQIVASAQATGASNEVIVLLNGLPEQDYPDAGATLKQLG